MTLLDAIDVSDAQPRDLSHLIAAYRPAHVIVHLYSVVESPPWEHSAAQIASAQANGCTVGGYVFLYPGVDHVRALNSVLDRCASIGLVLPLIWLDVEEYAGAHLDVSELLLAISHLEALQTPAGIYTSRKMWGQLGNPTGFEDCPTWIAQYDGVDDLNSVQAPPNLPRVVAKQYRGNPLDLDVILSEYAELPAPDPCADVRNQLELALSMLNESDTKLAALLAALDERLARRPWRAITKAEAKAIRALAG